MVDKKILTETGRNLDQELKDFYQQDYNYDQRKYKGNKPPQSQLGAAVEKFEKELENAKYDEDEQLHRIADQRQYERLSKMSIASMSYDDLEILNRLRAEYPNMDIQKGITDGEKASMSDSSKDPNITIWGEINRNIEELENLASQQGLDISEEVQFVKVQLKNLMDALKKIPDDDAGKVVSKALKKYDLQKSRKSAQSRKKHNTIKKTHRAGPSIELVLDDPIPAIGARSGETMEIFSNGTWSKR